MSDTPRYTDGALHEREISVRPVLQLPFSGNPSSPDVFARVFKRTFQIRPDRYLSKISNRTSFTNLLLYSEQFNNAAWSTVSASVAANTIANPLDGAVTADTMSPTSSGAGAMRQNVTVTAVPMVAAVFAKRVPGSSCDGVSVQLTDINGPFNTVFGLNGSVEVGTTGFPVTTQIDSLGNGWYRFSIFFTPAAGAATAFFYGFRGNSSGSSSGPVYLYGASLVPASTPVPYIPTTSVARTVIVPDTDAMANPASLGGDPFAFHVAEADPRYDNARRGTVERTYARVPRQQIVPDTKLFNRPVLNGTKSGTAYAYSVYPGRDHIATSRLAATASTVPASTAAGPFTSGTITFHDGGGHTCSLAMNSSAATFVSTMSAALTSLSGITASGGTGFLNLAWTGTMTSIVPPAGVTTFPGAGFASFVSDTTVTTPAVLEISCTGHSAVVGDLIPLWNGDALLGFGVLKAVIDANTFTIIPDSSLPGDFVVTHCAIARNAALCVLNGPKACSIQRITNFYLPGYTEGIATAADIPGQDPATDAVNWLTAILAGTTWVNIDDPSLKPYQGPILQYDYAQVQLADAVVTVTP